jgi:hypothetical protein
VGRASAQRRHASGGAARRGRTPACAILSGPALYLGTALQSSGYSSSRGFVGCKRTSRAGSYPELRSRHLTPSGRCTDPLLPLAGAAGRRRWRRWIRWIRRARAGQQWLRVRWPEHALADVASHRTGSDHSYPTQQTGYGNGGYGASRNAQLHVSGTDVGLVQLNRQPTRMRSSSSSRTHRPQATSSRSSSRATAATASSSRRRRRMATAEGRRMRCRASRSRSRATRTHSSPRCVCPAQRDAACADARTRPQIDDIRECVPLPS